MNFNPSPGPNPQATTPITATLWSLLCPPRRLGLVLPVQHRGPSIQHPSGAPESTQ